MVGREEVVFIYEFVCEPRSKSYLKLNLTSKATFQLNVDELDLRIKNK